MGRGWGKKKIEGEESTVHSLYMCVSDWPEIVLAILSNHAEITRKRFMMSSLNI
jgi:hypothetical protein